MVGATEHEREVLRVPVEAPWLLGTDAECVIDHGAVTLRDAGTGGEVRWAPSDLVWQTGRTLVFRSRAVPIGLRCIEFAGVGRDAQYEVSFPDEATAAMVAARIQSRFATRP